MSSLFDTPIRMAREMRQRYFSDDCSPMSAFAGIFRDYHIELQYESHGDSLRREGETLSSPCRAIRLPKGMYTPLPMRSVILCLGTSLMTLECSSEVEN